ncbi:SDR family NAD(P)-dependent oxidoreductase [Streptomyces sp. NBC_00378]|uniref:type I polyketide synthase n=1 Tax=Streptomyces sp. NBC_00378 TaxID=2975732 RepID=UPI002254934B|nr:type I polyketide synthase [Streptomyces sp. NBC_00378]MCX5115055.1 SDR family NAD(P)-dependent oxidoreductase [Streptomyces sp. NBC_00378]
MANEETLRDYLKLVAADLHQTRQRLREVEARDSEPIAVVAMSCRYPGGVRNPEQLWQLVDSGIDAVSDFPEDRGWNRGDTGSGPQEGASFREEGGFIYDATDFDPAFFGISPREALAMDPQQRLLLECAWEALETAGITPDSLAGSRTGVFTGTTGQDYSHLLAPPPAGTEGYILTGTAASVVSGRIAYTLGLEGPAVSVDTACSTSLVNIHLAAQALRNGECTLALAGGATIMSTPSAFGGFSEQGGLAADARCKAFSAAADGTGWSEGVGILLLERLSDARRNGHDILAVVRGSAVNQDGASNGLTAPNGPSQQRVILDALANARLTTADVDVVEAHGTGTRLGDPIEAEALLATYGQNRPEDRPLWLGSLKSNIGHTQGAAGVGGVIKMVMAMRHGVLPQTLHADEPSPHVDWSAGAVELLTEARTWPATGAPRRAGVSSFGMSGTNAHILIEQAPETVAQSAEGAADGTAGEANAEAAGGATDGASDEASRAPALRTPAVPWVLSAKTEQALAAQAERLHAHLRDHFDIPLADIGYSLALTRTAFNHRAAVVAGEHADFLAALESLAEGTPSAAVVSGTAGRSSRPVFVFPGQGAQWFGMAVGLLESSPVFAARMAECAAALEPYVDWSLLDVVRGASGAPGLDRVDVVQPVLWAVMVSLAEVWRSFGVRPAAVIGHSQGEIAAAAVAGILTLGDAAKVVALRSRAIIALAGRGGMVSVAQPAAWVREKIAAWDGRISIAAVNGPSSVVVSGDPEALGELVTDCQANEIRARRIDVDYASHSAYVEEIETELAKLLAGIAPQSGDTALYSSLTGGLLDGTEMGAGYWYNNLRETVEFEQATRTALADGHTVFIEVSPHPVLTIGLQGTIDDAGSDAATIGTLRRDEDEAQRLLMSLSEAHCHGVDVDWTTVFGTGATRVALPTYAFQRTRYWPEFQYGATVAAAQSVDPDEARFWQAIEQGNLEALAGALDGADTEPLRAALPALTSWRRSRQERSTIDSWRYRVTWKPVPSTTEAALPGRWLLVVPENPADGDAELADTLADGLARHGAEIVRTTLRGLPDAGLPDIDGIVSLVGLDETPHAEFTALPGGLIATVDLVKFLIEAAGPAPLWTVTRGAVAVGRSDPPADPAQATVTGFGRVVGLEHPGWWGGQIDLPAVLDDRALARVAGILGTTGDEDQVAVRASGVFARRLVRAPFGEPVQSWNPRGTILITGGTGALGTFIARWLADQGAEHLVLTSRRGPAAPGAAELEAELTAKGVRATIAACDVSDRTAVENLVAGLRSQGDPVTAVIHTAGVSQLSSIEDTDHPTFADVITAKAAGARNLDHALGDDPLDAFVVFSSISGIWGSGGQGAYAAANTYLDAFAADRRARGRTATAVSWGAWGGAGMAKGEAEQLLSRRGLPVMDPDLTINAMRQAVEHGETTLTVADIRWDRFVPSFTVARRSPLLEDLPEVREILDEAEAEAGGAESGVTSALQRRLAGLTPAEQRNRMVELVRGEAAAVLGYADAGALDTSRPFRELGFDSLTAVDVRNRLNTASGLRLPATLVFDHPTVAELAGHLLTLVLDEPAGDPSADQSTAHSTALSPTGAGPDEDPVVIVGMSCRFPGGANSPEDLWRVVAHGIDTVGDIPADRGWPGSDTADRPVAAGGWLAGAGDFDAGFFGINPREALAMDPQQRLLLEASWEALERSGIDPSSMRGSRTGVYIGASSQGYGSDVTRTPEGTEGYLMTGTATAVLSGRVSYTLGLEGPAVTVDTACSSSLVALHMAVQALRGGECSAALVGGVAVMATGTVFAEFSRQGGLAGDGRVKAFADAADGTGWGEGVGVLLVERLSDAVRNGHDVLAVVRGSAINQDGASNGLTAPNGPAQQRVIRQALAGSGLSAADIDVVEAHGTGTTLGDPIEAQALLATYGQERAEDRPLWLGSLKSNIGHTQAAAGVASIIKMVMAMRHGVLPRTLHVDTPSTEVDWSAGAVELLTEAREWPATEERPRRAGVSSFGVSGTNAHTILEEPPAVAHGTAGATTPGRPAPATVPWVLSGRGESALRAQAELLAEQVSGQTSADPAPLDTAWSLATGRAHLEHRAVVVAGDREKFLTGLKAIAAGIPAPGVVRGSVQGGRSAFLFSGQGSQRAGMGRELYEAYPVFADAFDAVCAELDRHLDQSVRDVVFGGSELIDQTVYTQAGLFAVEVALFRLLEQWGVTPDYLLGHSIGELAAAHVAGVWSLEDAAALVAARGRLMQALPTGGAMVAVQATEAEVLPLLTGDVSIAALNGPDSVVISGDEDAVLAIASGFGKTKRLRVSHAFHSPRMEPMLAEFKAVADNLTFHAPKFPIVSNLTGEVAGEELLTAGYWVEHVRQVVRYLDGVRQLEAQGVTTYLELGPGGVLSAMGQSCVTDDEAGFVPALRKDRTETEALTTAVAELYAHGASVDWAAYYANTGARRVGLPTYAFQHEHYWLRSSGPALGDLSQMGMGTTEHPFLDASVSIAGSDGLLLSGRIGLDTHPWLADHAVMGTVLLPGAAFVDLAAHAAAEAGCDRVEELTIAAPLVLGTADAVVLQLWAGPAEDGRRPLEIHSRPAHEAAARWTRHASGVLVTDTAGQAGLALTAWPPQEAEPVPVDGVYDFMNGIGYGYGPVFQGLRAVWRGKDEVFAEVALPEDVWDEAGRFGLHPALLDSALHAIGVSGGSLAEGGQLPFAWTGVSVYAVGSPVLRVRITTADSGAVSLDLADAAGSPVARIDSLVMRPLSAGQLAPPSQGGSDSLFRLEWTPAGVPTSASTSADVDVDADADADVVTVLEVPALGSVTGTDVVSGVHERVSDVLNRLQDWLGADHDGRARLVVVTRGAVAAGGSEVSDLAAAAVWGLVRSAQSEHPHRIGLVDLDDSVEGHDFLAALAASGEQQAAVRAGEVYVPRLARVTDPDPDAQPLPAVDGAVLVTGASGGLGGLVARHLVETWGARNLVLAARRPGGGPDGPGLIAEIESLGATARWVTCDAGDRAALAAVIDEIAAQDGGLAGVVHAAGVVDDGVLESLTPERITDVLRPKADAGWHLHELTAHLDLSFFALYSSAAGTFGGPGQANYAAANAFLDALAAVRRAQGLPATSLAWGPWGEGGMLGELGAGDIARMSRAGMTPLSAEQGLGLFDAAARATEPHLLLTRLTPNESQVRADMLPPLLRPYFRTATRPQAAAGRPGAETAASLKEQLSRHTDDERYRAVLDVVREAIATVLGHSSSAVVEVSRGFLEIGFDSLTAVELRNRINQVTGLKLAATLIFDHPSPEALARHLSEELASETKVSALALLSELDRIEASLAVVPADDDDRSQVTERLRGLLSAWTDSRPTAGDGQDDTTDLESATADELFDLLDGELGLS